MSEPYPEDGVPQGPEDFESTLRPTPWHRCEPVGEGQLLKVVAETGDQPLERVEVDESSERVTITLYLRWPPAFDPDGTPIGIPAVARFLCVEVPLGAPLAGRPLYDGATGLRPADRPDRHGELDARDLELDTLPCTPMPSGAPVAWDSGYS